jgi:glucans biosynthesis protein
LDTSAHRFDYRLSWLAPGLADFPHQPAPFVHLHAASGIEPNTGTGRLFVLDYHVAPGFDQDLDTYAKSVDLDFGTVTGAQISGQTAYALRDDPRLLRVSFVLTPAPDTQNAELRLSLRAADGTPLAPVWLYRWSRRRDGGV